MGILSCFFLISLLLFSLFAFLNCLQTNTISTRNICTQVIWYGININTKQATKKTKPRGLQLVRKWLKCRITLHADEMVWSWHDNTQAKQAKQNAVESKLKSFAKCLSILHTNLTRASHPPAAFKHLILICTDKAHFRNCPMFATDLFNTTLVLRKWHFTYRLIAVHEALLQAAQWKALISASLAEGLPRALWSRARAHQPVTAAVFQQLPTVGSYLQKRSDLAGDLLFTRLRWDSFVRFFNLVSI